MDDVTFDTTLTFNALFLSDTSSTDVTFLLLRVLVSLSRKSPCWYPFCRRRDPPETIKQTLC